MYTVRSTTPTASSTPNEHANRTAKAHRLAAIFTAQGLTRSEAKAMPSAVWALAATLDARLEGKAPRPPSAATRAETLLAMPLDHSHEAATEELLASGF